MKLNVKNVKNYAFVSRKINLNYCHYW
jgi:hypothetical protein